MALLDVSDVLADPDFTELVTIRRRKLVVDEHGRTSTHETLFSNVVAVINASSPNNLERKEDYGSFARSISLVLQFRIIGQAVGYLPDVIVWRGNNYIVDSFDQYPQYGKGFYQAECQCMDKNDNVMDLAIAGQLTFNTELNSGNIYACF